jgi:N-formylglutamate deformylase
MTAERDDSFTLMRGSTPLLISMPHVGTELPEELAARMIPLARTVPDTDWHLRTLYDFAESLGATIIAARYSRYVIDLNRPPDNASLYPGRDTTALCPLDTFDNEALYLPGQAPGAQEIAQRLRQYWQPYHDALASEIDALRARHGKVWLWDAHSIRSVLPRFFEGRLPDLNFGTADGQSCTPEAAQRVIDATKRATSYTAILNGRYKGGYITRKYGDPARGVQAIQLEMAQAAYMDETPPFAFDEKKAAALRPYLREMVEAFTRA